MALNPSTTRAIGIGLVLGVGGFIAYSIFGGKKAKAADLPPAPGFVPAVIPGPKTPGYTPPSPVTPPSSPPTDALALRNTARSAWGKGCSRGMTNGWADAANGISMSAEPGSGQAASSGNPAAYRAAYTLAYNAAWIVRDGDVFSDEGENTSPTSGERSAGESGCMAEFNSWWEANGPSVSGAFVSGCSSCGMGSGRRRPRLAVSITGTGDGDAQVGVCASCQAGKYGNWWMNYYSSNPTV